MRARIGRTNWGDFIILFARSSIVSFLFLFLILAYCNSFVRYFALLLYYMILLPFASEEVLYDIAYTLYEAENSFPGVSNYELFLTS